MGIEIRPEDIIKRPAEVIAKSAAESANKKGGSFLQQLVDGVKMAKQIKKELEELGVDVTNLFGAGSQGTGGQPPPPPGSTGVQPPADARSQSKPVTGGVPTTQTPAQQFKSILKILQIQYGDISVNELLEKLKSQFGDKKISDFLKEN